MLKFIPMPDYCQNYVFHGSPADLPRCSRNQFFAEFMSPEDSSQGLMRPWRPPVLWSHEAPETSAESSTDLPRCG